MILLSKEVNDWLAIDAQNVIVIHCKGGKGRTETMIYTCLIATGMFLTTKETIDSSGEQTFHTTYTNAFQKIAIPSQDQPNVQERLTAAYALTSGCLCWETQPEA
ncbi:phosphatidylinositol 3,4,5-trisphosphate 3-phosphatase TPTE2-like [Dipodomys merriami]|uniref:phosphatidylinositol 3,4,5-trisphosphate 3-phosphatase TPTE2-like n=1 Tax=Dipodomys merriami TaxID=94247 RepID=UPI0038558124